MPSPSPSPPSPHWSTAFNTEIKLLLKPNNPQARSLFAFIRRTLFQYGLLGRFSEADIFIEAYLRGFEKTTGPTGEPIYKPKAWMRQTSLNVIREKAREMNKMIFLHEDTIEEIPEELVDEVIHDSCINAVFKAIEQLSHDDRKIIELRFLEGRSWKDVQERLGQPYVKISALRQRGQRALKRLRKEYHKLKPPKLDDDDA